jgi:hypothetical protein
MNARTGSPALDGVHLVGSAPLHDAEEVFRTAAHLLGPRLARLPDGETGARKNWIAWQFGVLAQTPGLVEIAAGDRGYLRRQLVQISDDWPSAAPPRFGALGYADAALASYAIFARLQREEVIPPGVRFQVSLPTPLAPMSVFVRPEDRARVEPAYEAAMLGELGRIVAGIPHDRLAVQWDVAAEFGHLEGIWPAHFVDVEGGVLVRLARLAAAVPRDVSLGFHLCYGDFGHRHFVEPKDAARLVRVANALSAGPRRIDWMHMPIPIGWREPASYAPLAGLALHPDTRLYLGVVHQRDGAPGARTRIALAGGFVPRFGVATECGLGRRDPATIGALLALHAELVAPG